MKTYARGVATAVVLAAFAIWGAVLVYWYTAEWDLANGNHRLDAILRGSVVGVAASASAAQAQSVGERALRTLPGDERALLIVATAKTLRGQGGDARDLLEAATKRAGRAELVLALGRARAATGDESGARQAFLRASWISPSAVATLPRSIRNELLAETEALQQALAKGELTAAPP